MAIAEKINTMNTALGFPFFMFLTFNEYEDLTEWL